MSSLNSFTINSVEKDNFEVTVNIIHPDEHQLVQSPNFALQVILEMYTNIICGHIYNSNWCSYPFSQEEANNLLTKVDTKLLEKLCELSEGKKTYITKKEYKEYSKKEWVYKGNKFDSMGSHNEQYFVQFECEHEQICIESEKIINKIQIIDVKNYPHWFDTIESWLDYTSTWDIPEEIYELNENQPYPEYKLKIFINEEYLDLLNLLHPKSYWETSGYDHEMYTQKYKPNYQKDHSKLLYSSEIQMPSNEELTLWWEKLSLEWKKTFYVNLLLQTTDAPGNLLNDYQGRYIFQTFEHKFGKISLKELNLNDLQNIVRMKMIFGSGVKLLNLEPIKMLPNLLYLEIEGTSITSISELEHKPNIQFLNIYSNEILEFQPLSFLKNLKYIYFDPTKQQDLDLLGTFYDLRIIHFLCSYSDGNLNFLKKLEYLKEVTGYMNSFSKEDKKIIEKLKKRNVVLRLESEDEEIESE